MAKRIFTDINLNGNKIKKGKVDIPNREEIGTDDVIDKQYVNDEDTYASDLSDPDDGLNNGKPLQGFGGITTDTYVDNKTNSELWDLALYPREAPVYVQPIVSIVNAYTDEESGPPITPPFEVGSNINVELTAAFTFNDSDGLNGLNPYGWSGDGFPLGIQQSSINVVYVNLDVEPINSWQVDVSFLGASVKTDTHGDDDPTGQFGPLVKTATKSLTSYWPYWVSMNNGLVDTPRSGTELRLLPGKIIGQQPTSLSVVFPGDSSSKTLIIAIPALDVTISAIKDGAQPIAPSAWEKSTIQIDSLGTSGQMREYTIFKHNNGIGYSSDSVYDITITY